MSITAAFSFNDHARIGEFRKFIVSEEKLKTTKNTYSKFYATMGLRKLGPLITNKNPPGTGLGELLTARN